MWALTCVAPARNKAAVERSIEVEGRNIVEGKSEN